MKTFAEQFIGKLCIIDTFDSGHLDGGRYDGTIKEVSDGAILLEKKDGKTEAINLDFVVRIREYPTNKKGKKKSVVIE